ASAARSTSDRRPIRCSQTATLFHSSSASAVKWGGGAGSAAGTAASLRLSGRLPRLPSISFKWVGLGFVPGFIVQFLGEPGRDLVKCPAVAFQGCGSAGEILPALDGHVDIG